MERFYVVTLGCPKNEVDSEVIAALLVDKGYERANSIEAAHIVLVNSCTFVEDATRESIDVILDLAKFKIEGMFETLIVCGCLAQRWGKELIRHIPEIDAIWGTSYFHKIPEVIQKARDKRSPLVIPIPCARNSFEIKRLRLSQYPWSYVKISDGCSRTCTFCVIPQLKGAFASKPIDDILEEISYLLAHDVKEIVLIGQDISQYGLDFGLNNGLELLLKELVSSINVERLRLLYLHPEGVTKSLLEIIADSECICNYLDIPIQHIHPRILHKMGRGDSVTIRKAIQMTRDIIPEVIVRTSVIVGFPGEDDQAFSQLYLYLERTRFDRLGIFMYSPEAGTVAAQFTPCVSKEIKEERYLRLFSLHQSIAREQNEKLVDTTLQILLDGEVDASNEEKVFQGRSYMDAPEIDHITYVNAEKASPGAILPVHIDDAADFELWGHSK